MTLGETCSVEKHEMAAWRRPTAQALGTHQHHTKQEGGRHSMAAILLHVFEIQTDKTSWIILLSYVLNSLLCGTRSP